MRARELFMFSPEGTATAQIQCQSSQCAVTAGLQGTSTRLAIVLPPIIEIREGILDAHSNSG